MEHSLQLYSTFPFFILNKASNSDHSKIYELLKKYDLDVLGVIPFDENINPVDKNSKVVQEAIKQFYFRLNLPQGVK